MNCPQCGVWSEVLATRTHDGGHRVVRSHRCANLHRFKSVQVHQPVYCSAKPRQRNYLASVAARVKTHRRRVETHRLKASGVPQTEIAARQGISTSLVSLDLKRKP